MEEHHLSGPEHKLERLIFSDAVFAIAITLLVIDLHAPHLNGAADTRAYWEALYQETPSFAGFVISFLAIGAFWAGHHRGFALARRWHEGLTGLNLLLLMAIAALPFFTAFLSANSGARLPAVLYCAWLLLAALLNVALQRLVTSPSVVDPSATPAQVSHLTRRGWGVVIGAALGLVLTLVTPVPAFGLLGLATTAPFQRLLTRKLTLPHG